MIAGKGEVLVVAATGSSRKIAKNLAAAPIQSMQHPIPNIEFHFKYNGVASMTPWVTGRYISTLHRRRECSNIWNQTQPASKQAAATLHGRRSLRFFSLPVRAVWPMSSQSQ